MYCSWTRSREVGITHRRWMMLKVGLDDSFALGIVGEEWGVRVLLLWWHCCIRFRDPEPRRYWRSTIAKCRGYLAKVEGTWIEPSND